MILVYAHNAWGCSRSWKSSLVCALLLCDRCAEMLPNIRGSRPRDNANIDVIDHVHGRLNVFCWRKRRYQVVRVHQEVGTIVCHAGS